jgi:hypothetical protein
MSPMSDVRWRRANGLFGASTSKRLDVRVDGGIEACREGRGFKIVELNGATFAATHIYHRGYRC